MQQKRKKKTKASNTRQPAGEAALILTYSLSHTHTTHSLTHSRTLCDCVTMKKKKVGQKETGKKGFDDAQTVRAGVHVMSCPCVCLSNVSVSVFPILSHRTPVQIDPCPFALPFLTLHHLHLLSFFSSSMSRVSFFQSISRYACSNWKTATCISRESKSRCGKVMFGLPGNKPMDKVAVIFCFSFSLVFCLAHSPQKRPSLFSPLFSFLVSQSRVQMEGSKTMRPMPTNSPSHITHHTHNTPRTETRRMTRIVTSKITVCRDRDTTKWGQENRSASPRSKEKRERSDKYKQRCMNDKEKRKQDPDTRSKWVA